MTPVLRIEYLRTSRSRWAGWVLLGLGLFLVIDMGLTQKSLEEQLAVWGQSASTAGVTASKTGKSGTSQDHGKLEAQFQEAERVLQQLAMPWSPLFQSIEQAHTDEVALLSIQPDPQRRSVTITGEAKDYADVLVYVTRLRDQAKLTNVHLVGNELREDDPQRPMAFTVSANWKQEP